MTTKSISAPVSNRKIEKIVSALRLEAPIARLPRGLRFAIARHRYSWIDQFEALLTRYDGPRSLIETDRLNTIFVHIPKAAGVSVAESLFSNHGAAHVPLYMYLALYGSNRFDGMFKFTIARHPLDRVASAFSFLKTGGMTSTDADWAETNLAAYDTLDAFLCEGLTQPHIQDWVHFKPQVFYLRDPRTGGLGVDFVGRFENLQADFDHIARTLGVEAHLKHANKTTAPREISLSPEGRRVLENVYREDFEILGY